MTQTYKISNTDDSKEITFDDPTTAIGHLWRYLQHTNPLPGEQGSDAIKISKFNSVTQQYEVITVVSNTAVERQM